MIALQDCVDKFFPSLSGYTASGDEISRSSQDVRCESLEVPICGNPLREDYRSEVGFAEMFSEAST